MKKYRLIATITYALGATVLAYFSGQELLSPDFTLRSIEVTSPIIYFIGWTVIGGYYLVYDYVPDYGEKWIEGIISGLSVSIFLYIADRYFVFREYHEQSDFWSDHSWTIVTKRAWLPNEVILLVVCFFVAWLAIDIWKSKFDNAIVKFVLYITSIISYLVVPASSEAKILFTTIISTSLAIGYYYFRQIENKRKQISMLLYATLSLGVVATIVKHWDFFSRELLIQEYTLSGLAEVFSDFVIFLLGFLLTILEATKTDTNQRQQESPVQQIPHETHDDKKVAPDKSNASIYSAIVLLLLVGVVAMIKSFHLTSKLNDGENKRLRKSKTG